MGLSLNTNVSASTAHRALRQNASRLDQAMERLSSGLRINRAADDAAGLAIAEKLRSQSNGMNQALANAQNGISLTQTADGALGETHAMLQRVRTLAVQAANGTLTDGERSMMQKEVYGLIAQVTEIARTTEFNGMPLLNGTFTGKFLQIGANAGDTMAVDIPGAAARDLGLETPRGAGTRIHTPDHLGHLPVDTPPDPLAPSKPFDDWSMDPNPMVSSSEKVFVPGNYTIADLDVKDSKGNIVGQVTDGGHTIAFDDGSSATFAKSVYWNDYTQIKPKPGNVTLTNVISVETQDLAELAIGQCDAAITEVSAIRAGLGATQNRLDHVIGNLGVSAENLAAAESRIRDADMAKELAEQARASVLDNAGTSMLAQANSSQQMLLKLLG